MAELKDYDIFSAHMFKPDVDHIRKLGDVMCITLFRDPVERALSGYNYLKAQALRSADPTSVPVFNNVLELSPVAFFDLMLKQNYNNKLFLAVGDYNKIKKKG